MDLFTAISIIVLVLIVITPFLALAIGFTARKRIDNIIKLFDRRIMERDRIISGLQKDAEFSSMLIEELTKASKTLLLDYDKKNQQLKDLESAYNLLSISVQNKDTHNIIIKLQRDEIAELRAKLEKLENQS